MKLRHRHHHGYVCTQMRVRSWWTRRCANDYCGEVQLTGKARLLLAASALLIGAAVLELL